MMSWPPYLSKNESTVTTIVLVRFSEKKKQNKKKKQVVFLIARFGVIAQVLRHHLPVKITVGENVKTVSDVNPETKCRF